MKKFFKIFLVGFAVCALTALFTGCSNNSQNENVNQQKITVKGHIRDKSFNDISTEIYYDGNVCGNSDSFGYFTVDIPYGYDISKLTLNGESIAYRTFNSNVEFTEIIKLNAGESFSANDYYALSGKIVLHSDGESVASGVELRIDGNTVFTTGDNRNFDLLMVHKDSVISVFKEESFFIDRFGDEYNNVCFADKLTGVTEEQNVEINGASISVKHLTGVTFRLNDINN